MIVGHFTQIVWKETTLFGMGMATSDKTGKTYIVAYYSPPGNWLNEQFIDNVVRPVAASVASG